MKRQHLLIIGILCFILTSCQPAAVRIAAPAAPTPLNTAPQESTSSANGPPLIPTGPLGDLDQLFIDSYTLTRSESIRRASPFVVISGSSLILHRNGQKDAARVIPDHYHALKDIAHLPFTIYLQLSPFASTGTPLIEAKATQLRALLARIQAVQGVLATSGFASDEMARQLEILAESQALITSTLNNNRITQTSLDAFTHKMGPLMLLNASDAACLQIQGTHAQMMKWKELLSMDEWQGLIVVNRARHQARYRNAATQYFHWLFNDNSTSWSYPGESMRVIYAESLGPKEDASDELATVIIDAGASAAFFGDPWRLSEDILSNGAAHCIARLPEADRVHR